MRRSLAFFALVAVALAACGCRSEPSSNLEQIGSPYDPMAAARAFVADVSDDIGRIKDQHAELSGWRPTRSGMRSVTYDYRSGLVSVDVRATSEKQPGGATPRMRLPSLGLNVYCTVDGGSSMKSAVERIFARRMGQLADIERRKSKEPPLSTAPAKPAPSAPPSPTVPARGK